MKIIYSLLFAWILVGQVQAQQEISVPLMTHLSNFDQANPAYIPENQWVVRLPSIGFGMMHNGPSFSDLFDKQSSGSYKIDGNQAIDKFDKHNIFGASFSGDLLGISYTTGGGDVFSLKYGMYVQAAMDYSNDAAKLLLKGNGEYVGESLVVGPGFSIHAYDKLGIGYARKLDQWSFGARVNFLFGRKTLSTDEHFAKLTTSGDYYALDLLTNYTVKSSNFLNIDMNTNDVTFEDMTYKPGLGKSGFGVGIDFGFSYQIDDKSSVFSSITNMGSINWKEKTTTYSSHQHSTYNGVQITNLAKLDTASLAGMLDSIQQFVNLEATSSGTFKTKLNPTYMAGGTWKLTDKTTFNGVIAINEIMGNILPSVGVGVQQQMNDWAWIGGSVSYQNKRLNHLGVNTTLKFGPVQMFMATDNIMTFIFPKSSGTFHLRAGMNLLLGRVKKRSTIYGLG